MKKHAVYPGTFDPLTLGHLDLIARSARIFDRVTVAVAATSVKKGAMFDVDERMEMVREACGSKGLDNIDVMPLDTLLVDFCHRFSPSPVVVRGLRVYSDFEYEFQMALTNRKLAPDIETLFMMPHEEYSYVTASMVREIAAYGGDVSMFVPDAVVPHVRRYAERNKATRARKSK
ncbi:MAG: pantetheine-phosphate adenylyltransferase [Kiritimatiellae bacterium]|nr:pantetheine-phosphate adenylyltransferase [Kiritimatiellia bacterium]